MNRMDRSPETKMDPRLEGISLHHLIRGRGNSHAQVLRGMEDRFRHMEESEITPKHVKDYKREIECAEVSRCGETISLLFSGAGGRVCLFHPQTGLYFQFSE